MQGTCWQYSTRSGVWLSYPPEIQAQLEKAFKNGEKIITLTLPNPDLTTEQITFSFDDWIHFNRSNGCHYLIRRQVADRVPVRYHSKFDISNKQYFAEKLCDACWNNDGAMVSAFLQKHNLKSFINYPNSRGLCALYCASRQGHVQIVIQLLNCEYIDVNTQQSEHLSTALHTASFGQKPEIVALLLMMGANSNITNKNGVTPLQEARGGVTLDVYRHWQNGEISTLVSLYPSISELAHPHTRKNQPWRLDTNKKNIICLIADLNALCTTKHSKSEDGKPLPVWDSQTMEYYVPGEGETQEAQLASKLRTLDPVQANLWLEQLNWNAVKDYGEGRNLLETLLSFIQESREIMEEMSVKSRAKILEKLCPNIREEIGVRESSRAKLWMARVFLTTPVKDLNALKNRVDFHAEYHNLHRIVFEHLGTTEGIAVLEHIQKSTLKQKQPHSRRTTQPIKVLADIDDTFICSGGNWPAGVDARFPAKTPYPGVFAFFCGLDLGFEKIRGDSNIYETRKHTCNLSFLTARPSGIAGVIENSLYQIFTSFERGDMASSAKLCIGKFKPVANKKKMNFTEYSQLWPEYNFVFIGDNSQGDYICALKMLEDTESMLEVFIHLVQPKDQTPGYSNATQYHHDHIHFFETYIGAAIAAYVVGLIPDTEVVAIIKATTSDMEALFQKFSSDKDESTIDDDPYLTGVAKTGSKKNQPDRDKKTDKDKDKWGFESGKKLKTRSGQRGAARVEKRDPDSLPPQLANTKKRNDPILIKADGKPDQWSDSSIYMGQSPPKPVSTSPSRDAAFWPLRDRGEIYNKYGDPPRNETPVRGRRITNDKPLPRPPQPDSEPTPKKLIAQTRDDQAHPDSSSTTPVKHSDSSPFPRSNDPQTPTKANTSEAGSSSEVSPKPKPLPATPWITATKEPSAGLGGSSQKNEKPLLLPLESSGSQKIPSPVSPRPLEGSQKLNSPVSPRPLEGSQKTPSPSSVSPRPSLEGPKKTSPRPLEATQNIFAVRPPSQPTLVVEQEGTSETPKASFEVRPPSGPKLGGEGSSTSGSQRLLIPLTGSQKPENRPRSGKLVEKAAPLSGSQKSTHSSAELDSSGSQKLERQLQPLDLSGSQKPNRPRSLKLGDLEKPSQPVMDLSNSQKEKPLDLSGSHKLESRPRSQKLVEKMEKPVVLHLPPDQTDPPLKVDKQTPDPSVMPPLRTSSLGSPPVSPGRSSRVSPRALAQAYKHNTLHLLAASAPSQLVSPRKAETHEFIELSMAPEELEVITLVEEEEHLKSLVLPPRRQSSLSLPAPITPYHKIVFQQLATLDGSPSTSPRSDMELSTSPDEPGAPARPGAFPVPSRRSQLIQEGVLPLKSTNPFKNASPILDYTGVSPGKTFLGGESYLEESLTDSGTLQETTDGPVQRPRRPSNLPPESTPAPTPSPPASRVVSGEFKTSSKKSRRKSDTIVRGKSPVRSRVKVSKKMKLLEHNRQLMNRDIARANNIVGCNEPLIEFRDAPSNER